MAKKKLDKLVRLVREATPEVILTVAALCDGHTILDPKAFLEAGLPPEVVEHLSVKHHSDPSSPKSTIFVNGQPVEELSGVYGLDMLEFLASALGVTCRCCMGRGFQAQAI